MNFQNGDPITAALAPVFLFHQIWLWQPLSKEAKVESQTEIAARSATSEIEPATIGNNQSSQLLFIGGWLISYCFVLIMMSKDLATISYAAYLDQKQKSPAAQHLLSSDCAKYISWTEDYAGYINSGVSLLRANNATKAKVVACDFTNPFPFLLRAIAPKGDYLCWFEQTTFTQSSHLDAKRAFGDADVILMPAKTNSYNYAATPALKKIFGTYFQHNFERKDKNDNWELLVRKHS